MEIIQYVQTLPSKVAFAESVVLSTESKFQALISKCMGADWTTLSIEAINKTDALLSSSAAEAYSSAQSIENDRKPITLKLDEFKKEFTSREHRCYSVSNTLNDIRKKIALELKRRSDIEAQKALQITYQNNEESEFKRTLNQYLLDKSYAHAQQVMQTMLNGSLTNDLDQYSLFLNNLISFDIKKTITIDTLNIWLSHFTFEFRYIDPVVPVAMLDTWNDYIAPHIDQYRQQLISQADQRRAAISSKVEVSAEDVTSNLNKISEVITTSKEGAVSAINQASESEIIHKSFNSYAAVVKTRQNKGAKIAQELAPSNSGEWLQVIKFYVDNHFSSLDTETIEKKFGFMLNAVNKSMKEDGSFPAGVPLVDKAKIKNSSKVQP